MKNIFLTIPLLLLFSCAGEHEQADGNLEALKHKKDSLKEIHASISAQIAELDKLIQEKDTSKRLSVVSTYAVKSGTFAHYIEVYGQVEADKSITIFPETSGNIDKIAVKEGEKVKKGQLLMNLDADVLRQNMQEVNTQYDLANTVYERQAKLFEKNIGSEIQLLESKARRDALASQRSALQSRINMSTVRAPFDGVVDKIFPKTGEMAMPQQALIRLINLDKIYITSDVSESHLGSIRKGSKVKVEFPSLNKEYESEVEYVGQYIDPNNRTFDVQVKVPNEDALIKPNLLAKIKIQDQIISDTAIIIPNRMILQNTEGEDYVMLLGEDNTVKKQKIEVGSSYKDKTLVLSGLEKEDLIIDKGARSIREGQEVQVQ